MRLVVFFDIPVNDLENRRIAARFRKFLVGDGYDMLQYSVYSRVCNGTSGFNKHYERLKRNLPAIGSVKLLSLSEEQYACIETLVGEKDEERSFENQRTMVF